MIKPSDIPDEFVLKCDEIHPAFEGYDFDADDVAAILNAAIEAGLVSPPCYQPVLDGKPLTDNYGPTVFTTQRSVEEWFLDREICRESWGERHWKGQPE